MSNDGDLDRNVMKLEATEECKFLARRLLELKDGRLKMQLSLRKMKEGASKEKLKLKLAELTKEVENVELDYKVMKKTLDNILALEKDLESLESLDKKEEEAPKKKAYKIRIRDDDVPKLTEAMLGVWEILSFFGKFKITMENLGQPLEDQKRLLLGAIPMEVTYEVQLKGGFQLSIRKIFEVILRKKLGVHWKRNISDSWSVVRQKESESVALFHYKTSLYLKWMEMEPEEDEDVCERVLGEIRMKMRWRMWDYIEDKTKEDLRDLEWNAFWEVLEEAEASNEYQEREELWKLTAGKKPAQPEQKKKKEAEEKESKASKGSDRALRKAKPLQLPLNEVLCFRCGQKGHYAGNCDHPKGKLIKLGADGRWPLTCFNCWKEGHKTYQCPSKSSASPHGYVEMTEDDLGWVVEAELSREDNKEMGVEEVYFCFSRDIGPEVENVWEAPQKGIPLEVELEGNEPEGSFLRKVKFRKDDDVLVGLVDSKSTKGKEEAPREGGVCSELPASSSLTEERPRPSSAASSSSLSASPEKSEKRKEAEVLQKVEHRATGHLPAFPFTAGGIEIMAGYDTGSPQLFVREDLYKGMSGEIVNRGISYKGVSGGEVKQLTGKLVQVRTEIGDVDWVAYLMFGGFKLEGLVPRELAEELGVLIQHLPRTFVERVPEKKDERWIRDKEALVELKCSDEVSRKIEAGIAEAMKINSELPDGTQCNLPDSAFKIELVMGAEAMFTRQYPVPQKILKKVCERAQEWVDNQWTVLLPGGEKNNWNSPILAVKKVLGGRVAMSDIRLCMDFWEVNKLTKEPKFTIPVLKEMLGWLTGKKYFSELDLANAYHQVGLEKESQKITGFQIPGKGQAKWRVLFFGPKGAVTHFQKVMERVVGELNLDITIVIYVDNLLVASDSLEQHIDDVNAVIQAVTKAGMKLKPSKCKIAYKAIQFMGAIVDGDRRGVDPFKARVFEEMKEPKTGKQIQRVLGFVNFLRDFIPLFANVVGPLEALRSQREISEEKWESSGGKRAFRTLKEILSKTLVLENPDWSREFFLETDASQYGVGAVLFQLRGGRKAYVDFAVKAFNKAQRNYPAVKRELLAGLYTMEKWRPLLLYQKFYWGLDNKALTYLNSSQSRVVLNWIGLFQEYDFETWFKKGVLNVLPHELSHMYDLVPLDFGRQEAKREGNENGLGLLVAYARGGGSGFCESKKKFIEEQLERVAPESQAERVELVKKTHMESHMGAVILY